MNHDLHYYAKRLEQQKVILRRKCKTSKANKDLIFKFIDQALAEGITNGRVVRYMFDLKVWARHIKKNFKDCTIDDIRKAVSAIEQSEYAKSTKRDLKLTLRKFFKWMRGTEGFPPEVAWYRTHLKMNSVKTPEQLLTEEEVNSLIIASREPMVRAFVAALYESGCRIGEILPMKISQVHFDEHGAKFMVTGKTGFRRVRVFSCVPYLTDWLDRHPHKHDPEAAIWINRTGQFITYSGMGYRLRLLAKRAGVKKSVHFHNFRHSRATFLVNHLTEAQMKEYFGWVQDSGMASVYIHLSGRDVDQALFRLHGIQPDEGPQKKPMEVRRCTRCGLINQATNIFCKVCGLPLEKGMIGDLMDADHKRSEADKDMDELIKDQEFREMFLRKLGSLQKRKRLISDPAVPTSSPA